MRTPCSKLGSGCERPSSKRRRQPIRRTAAAHSHRPCASAETGGFHLGRSNQRPGPPHATLGYGEPQRVDYHTHDGSASFEHHSECTPNRCHRFESSGPAWHLPGSFSHPWTVLPLDQETNGMLSAGAPLKVRLLPSCTGSDPQRQFLTSFVVDDTVAIDAGSLAFALTAEEMLCIRHILITHAHADHTASLPIFISEVFPALAAPVTVHATPPVIDALRRFVFNGEIWPDFAQIPLLTGLGRALQFCALKPGTPTQVENLRVTPIWVNHLVPTVGYIVESQKAGFAVTSDTYVTDEIWAAASRLECVR